LSRGLSSRGFTSRGLSSPGLSSRRANCSGGFGRFRPMGRSPEGGRRGPSSTVAIFNCICSDATWACKRATSSRRFLNSSDCIDGRFGRASSIRAVSTFFASLESVGVSAQAVRPAIKPAANIATRMSRCIRCFLQLESARAKKGGHTAAAKYVCPSRHPTLNRMDTRGVSVKPLFSSQKSVAATSGD
jgi:hypothetical protein